ncbi:unnamed protein product, partial [Phaeothamnion confervicola]
MRYERKHVTLTPELLAASTTASRRRGEGIESILARLTHLHLNGKLITCLEDCDIASACPCLQVLYLYDNGITNAAPLAACRHITHLYLENNDLSTMAGLPVHTLQKLYLDGNCVA